ncbi:hypothetical protein DNFV4_00124 [Nitrospira tepida]|uniref:DUF5666 domain-containing protein n=1 Tax=Nitrospira tepida TaxID=2973512 RepID=A0AA86T0S9_9BACT|nr:hypothetical protein [Nitrospira tepida]CAI4029706.1 hypothetical protein DNFV4_00124 [Nitrospira tepida]
MTPVKSREENPSRRPIGSLAGAMVLSLLLAASPALADEGGKHSHGPGTHMKVSGEVTAIQSDLITIKTPWGQMRVASKTAPKNLEVGEQVEMSVNENNVVIDLHRKGDPAHKHRFVTGKLAYASKDRKEIKLWTPEGEKTFDVQSGRSQLAGIEEGTPISVELNEAGKVIDIHKMNVEMTFDEQPKTKAGYHITVHGVVDRIQGPMVAVKAPGGDYWLNAKTLPKDIKAGDEITLWVNEENIVVDHHQKGHDKAHRLVTGKLVYVGKMKKEIKLWTPEGEKVFPLERIEVKAKPIEEGSRVTIELNESGAVTDIWKAGS